MAICFCVDGKPRGYAHLAPIRPWACHRSGRCREPERRAGIDRGPSTDAPRLVCSCESISLPRDSSGSGSKASVCNRSATPGPWSSGRRSRGRGRPTCVRSRRGPVPSISRHEADIWSWLDTSVPFKSAAAGPVQGVCDVASDRRWHRPPRACMRPRWRYAKKGAHVVFLEEAETIGHAASGRNGGMCNNGFAQDYGTIRARLGKDVADRLYRAFDAGVDTVERLVSEEKIDCGSPRTGKIKLAAKPEHYDKLARGPGTAGGQRRSRHRHGQPCGPGRRGRIESAPTAGCSTARAPDACRALRCAGWPKRRRGVYSKCTSTRR